MRRIIYIGLVILAAAVVFSACYRSGSSNLNEDTDVGTDSKSDTGSDFNSDIGTDTGSAPGSDTGSDACAAMKASHDGSACNLFLGVSWDGKLCRSIYCGCTGDDCDQLYSSQEECVAARATCIEVCPYSDWPIVLTEEDDGCLCGNEQYQHCCPDGMDFCTCEEATVSYEEHLLCGEA
jgi:hypothetical protein